MFDQTNNQIFDETMNSQMVMKNGLRNNQFDATGGTSGMDVSGINEGRAEVNNFADDEYQDNDFDV